MPLGKDKDVAARHGLHAKTVRRSRSIVHAALDHNARTRLGKKLRTRPRVVVGKFSWDEAALRMYMGQAAVNRIFPDFKFPVAASKSAYEQAQSDSVVGEQAAGIRRRLRKKVPIDETTGVAARKPRKARRRRPSYVVQRS